MEIPCHSTHVVCYLKILYLHSNRTFTRMYFKTSAVRAALASPPAGPHTSISFKKLVEDEVRGTFQGGKDNSNTVSKCSMSAGTEVSFISISFIGNINHSTHLSHNLSDFEDFDEQDERRCQCRGIGRFQGFN